MDTEKWRNNLRSQLFMLGGIIVATIASGVSLLSTNFVSADVSQTIVKSATVHVEYLCSMSIDTSSAHSAILTNGQYSDNVGASTIMATCNNNGGYSFYAIGYGDDIDGNTSMIAYSPSTLTSSNNILTGTSGTGSYWAMKLTSENNNVSITNGFSVFSSIPSTYIKVATKASGTATNESSFTSTYKINVSNTQPAGDYLGKVKYTLVNPSTACPDGYRLEGGVCTKIIFDDITTMQAMTTSICTNAAVGDTKQLKDTRDEKYYWVTKLADEKCWMTQNLDLDLSDSVTLTPSDTNITSNWTPAAKTIAKTNLEPSNWATTGNYHHPYSFDGGDAYFPDGALPSNCTNKNFTACSGAGTLSLTDTSAVLNNTNAHYHVGNHYNWTAAIASNDSSGYTDNYENATSSICPKGWKLPSSFDESSSVNGDFTNLLNAYSVGDNSVSEILNAPLYFVRSGDILYGSLEYVGSGGYYWSNPHAYKFLITGTTANPTSYLFRYYGLSIRCLAW